MEFKRKSNKNVQLSKFVLMILLIFFSSVVSCRPSTRSKTSPPRPAAVHVENEEETTLEARIRPCHENQDLMELCQRCAKVTKAKIVFPMCCSNEDDATGWCRNYVYYGT